MFCISLEFIIFSFCSKSLFQNKSLFLPREKLPVGLLSVAELAEEWRHSTAFTSNSLQFGPCTSYKVSEKMRKNTSSHPHKRTLLTSFKKSVSLAGKTGLCAQGVPLVTDLSISKASNKLQPWLNLSLRSTEHSRVHSGASAIFEKSNPLRD